MNKFRNWIKKLLSNKARVPVKKTPRNPASIKAMADTPDTMNERIQKKVADTTMSNAIVRLRVNKLFFGQEHVLRQMEKANWANVDPQIIEFTAKFVLQMRRRGIPIYPHSAFRTNQEQMLLKARGRSRASYPRAPHCQGRAVDLVHCRYHWELTPLEWQYLGKTGKDLAENLGIKIRWGGDFKSFYDPAHWELLHWRQDMWKPPQLPALRATPTKLLQLSKR